MMRCLLHKWGKWGPLISRNMFWIEYKTGRKTPYVETFQRRICSRCEKVEEKVV